MKASFKAGLNYVNRMLAAYVGRQPRPPYHEIAKTYPSLQKITAAFPAIREEALTLVSARNTLPSYQELDSGQARIAGSTPSRWSVFFLDLFGFKPKDNRAACPRTCSALEGVPNVLQAFFSILDPGKSIPEHEGPYLGYLRYHLGLVVPKERSPSITVNGQTYAWKEGEAILFDDGYPHRVDNQASEVRVVLIVDVRRPMPFLPDLINRVVTDVIARWTYAYPIYRKIAHGQPAH